MSYRITEANVRALVEVDSDVATDLTPFIAAAEQLVTDCCPTLYSADKLALIEAWLAAHFYAIRAKVVKSEGVSGVSQSYESNAGQFLMATYQGQQALALDTAGGLAQLQNSVSRGNKGIVAGIKYLGDCHGTRTPAICGVHHLA